MKIIFAFVMILASFAHATDSCKPAQTPTSEPIGYSRASAIYADARLKSLMSTEVTAACPLPAPEALMATMVCNGGGDFSSCYYDIKIECTAGQPVGLKALTIKAEFSPPMGSPLNLDLGLSYKQ